jgi:signal transduction histidine kinase
LAPIETREETTSLVAGMLATPVAPASPDMTCAEVYERLAEDETLFSIPIVADGIVLGLADRIGMMSQFARPFWRELYSKRAITKVMDATPVLAETTESLDSVGYRLATAKPATLHAGFVVIESGRYIGVGSSTDLLRKVADRAQLRALALERAHAEIRLLNVELEHRVELRTAELRLAQEQIVRKERLAALGQLTATVAHELRNPLSSIRNSLFTVKDAVDRAGIEIERPLARMQRSIVRCDGIINDLLEYTRFQDLRRRLITVDTWLAETLGEQPIPSDIVVQRDFNAPGRRINFDSERMRRVVVNLIDNAVQAMTDGGPGRRIRVSTHVDRVDADSFELVVEDTGPGIPPDVLPRIFEPLFSTKTFGTGLGLPTVKQIVEQHGGDIAIDSEPGRGTRVTVRLRGAVAQEIEQPPRAADAAAA